MGHSSGRPVSIFLSGGTHSSWRDGIFSAFADERYYDPMTLSDVSDMAVIARTEREWLDATDVLFFYFEESNPSGLGSAFEVGYAVAKGIPVIFVDEKHTSHSEWLGVHCDVVVHDLASGIVALREELTRQTGRSIESGRQ
jgi:nucleoside 2-deoxyribosyltransferase